jgi:hypothetical protein
MAAAIAVMPKQNEHLDHTSDADMLMRQGLQGPDQGPYPRAEGHEAGRRLRR